MDFALKIDRLDREVAALRDQLAVAEDLTAKVLAVAEAHGLTRIGINKCDETVLTGGKWAFPANGNLFAKGRGESGWPIIWSVAEKAGLSAGCGNGDQHQITGAARLIDGIYELSDGKWLLVEEKAAKGAAA